MSSELGMPRLHSPLSRGLLLLAVLPTNVLSASTPVPAGFSLTFEGQGTDVATTRVDAEVFRGGSGISVTFWCRVFGFIEPPFEGVPLSMSTPTVVEWFKPFWWQPGGLELLVLEHDALIESEDWDFDQFSEWRHVAITWDSASGLLQTYLEGRFILSEEDVQPGYNLTKNTENGVYLALGINALSDSSHTSGTSFRGSLDQFQLWTHALSAEQVAADYQTLGTSAILPTPALRYTFDEGTSGTAYNTGTASGSHLLLGRSPEGLQYFTSGASTLTYTAPVWAPSHLPLNSSSLVLTWPVVYSYRPGIPKNISLSSATSSPVRIIEAPDHGQLRWRGVQLSAGASLPAGEEISFESSPSLPAASTSFRFITLGDGDGANITVHLLAESPPLVVYDPSPCTWPLGVLHCASVTLSVTVREDTPTVVHLIGRSLHGSDRTRAVVVTTASSGTLYQMATCCDPDEGRGAVIADGDEVLSANSAVVYVPKHNEFGVNVANLTFYVLDSSGTASDIATLLISVTPVEDGPVMEETFPITFPLTAVFVPLRSSDAESDIVTLTLAVKPSHGKVFLSQGLEANSEVSSFNGNLAGLDILIQNAVDVVAVSSYWPGDVDWHPLQILGGQDVFTYGENVRSWSPRLVSGDSGDEVISDSDSEPISLHNVTRQLSFSYNPTAMFEQFGYSEYIELKFNTPVFPTAIRIGENVGMCSVVRIQGKLSTDDLEFVTLWRGAADEECWKEYDEAKRYRIFRPTVCRHSFKIDVVRIEMDTQTIADWNEMDFVELQGSTELPAGVLPRNTSGLWYVPGPGFTGEDSLSIVAYDCPFDPERSSAPLHVPIVVDGFFPPPSPPAPVVVPFVRLGMLLPMFGTVEAGFAPIVWSPRVGVYHALNEINNKSDGVFDDLLPDTHLLLAYRDSKCDSTHALQATLQLTRNAFDGAGVSAIIGAGCSGASVTSAQVGEGSQVPLISPSSTSPVLSDGKAFPFFLRTIPSDAFAATAMVGMLHTVWQYSAVALVHSTDTYGSEIAEAFRISASAVRLEIQPEQSFTQNAADFSSHVRELRESGSRVIVLLCQTFDASNFMRTAMEGGVGGEGFLWLGGDTLVDAAVWEDDDPPLREKVFAGSFGVLATGHPEGSAVYDQYLARRRHLFSPSAPPETSQSCHLGVDDDGNYLWAGDHDGNASTPLVCSGPDLSAASSFDDFAYDAVIAIAHAVHEILEVRKRGKVVGRELLDALIHSVSFEGVTGLVDFHDASDDPDLLLQGDRRRGISYTLRNYVDNARGFVPVGRWTPCNDEGNCSWTWEPTPGVALTYSTSDNSKPPQSVASRCVYGETLNENGRCVCSDGFERDQTSQWCQPCPVGRYSQVGSSGCTMCAEGYYRPFASSGVEECTACDAIEGIYCPVNVTTQSVVVKNGYWRISDATLQLWSCKSNEGYSPCVGGANAGIDGNGYCAPEHRGPRCEVCNGTYRHYDGNIAACTDCPESAPAFLIAFAVICALVVMLHLVSQFLRNPPKSLEKASARLHDFVDAVHAVGPSKLKSAVTFYQIIMSLPSSFRLAPLNLNFAQFISAFDFVEIDWTAAIYPTGCLLGGYKERLFIVALSPFVVMFVFPVVVAAIVLFCLFFVGLVKASLHPKESTRRLSTQVRRMSANPGLVRDAAIRTIGANIELFIPGQISTDSDSINDCELASSSYSRKSQSSKKFSLAGSVVKHKASKMQSRMLKMLPLVLLIIFVMLPSVSRSIFAVWVCEPIQSGPGSTISYLERDPKIVCSSDDHQKVIAVAIAFIIVWPIGMQLILILALWFNRKALRAGINSSQTQALRFLTGGYKKEFFFWEPIEVFRRLACSGFVILIPSEFIFMRIAMCLSVSLPILVVTAVLRPFKNFEDTVLAVASQAIMVYAFCCCALLRIANSTYLTEEDKNVMLGFTDPTPIFVVLGFCFIFFLLLLFGTYLYKINDEVQKRLMKRSPDVSRASSRWIVGGAMIFGSMALVVAGVMYGLIASIVMSSTFFVIGAAVGSLLYSKCAAGNTQIRLKRYQRQERHELQCSKSSIITSTKLTATKPVSVRVEQATFHVQDVVD